MNFFQFLLAVRARFKIMAIVMMVTVLTTLAVSLLLPKTYKATATLVLNYKGTDPVTGLVLPSQLMPGYMATQVDIINSRNVALQVVDDLGLTEDTITRQNFLAATNGKGSMREWQAALLQKKLDVAPSRDSSVLNISFSGADPKFAAAVANAFANAYQHVSIQLKVDPSKKAALYFNEQIKLLRTKFEEAQDKVSKFQQENGIVSTDSRSDVETTRLNDLSSQLVTVQGQRMEASSRSSHALGIDAAESPDVMASPLIQNIKLQLAQAQLRLTGIAERFTENHPQYIQAKAEVDQLRAALNGQIAVMSKGIGNNARMLKKREAELRAALAEQTAKVLEANRKRDALKVLSNEMESAQRSYEAATQRFMQTNLEGQSNQADIALLNAAVPPQAAATPKVLVNTLLSVMIGALLGLGFAMLAELLDRRVRSMDDLVNGLKAPVLGVMAWGVQARRHPALSIVSMPSRLLAR